MSDGSKSILPFRDFSGLGSEAIPLTALLMHAPPSGRFCAENTNTAAHDQHRIGSQVQNIVQSALDILNDGGSEEVIETLPLNMTTTTTTTPTTNHPPLVRGGLPE